MDFLFEDDNIDKKLEDDKIFCRYTTTHKN